MRFTHGPQTKKGHERLRDRSWPSGGRSHNLEQAHHHVHCEFIVDLFMITFIAWRFMESQGLLRLRPCFPVQDRGLHVEGKNVCCRDRMCWIQLEAEVKGRAKVSNLTKAERMLYLYSGSVQGETTKCPLSHRGIFLLCGDGDNGNEH